MVASRGTHQPNYALLLHSSLHWRAPHVYWRHMCLTVRFTCALLPEIEKRPWRKQEVSSQPLSHSLLLSLSLFSSPLSSHLSLSLPPLITRYPSLRHHSPPTHLLCAVVSRSSPALFRSRSLFFSPSLSHSLSLSRSARGRPSSLSGAMAESELGRLRRENARLRHASLTMQLLAHKVRPLSLLSSLLFSLSLSLLCSLARITVTRCTRDPLKRADAQTRRRLATVPAAPHC